jgi:hypothetical protein
MAKRKKSGSNIKTPCPVCGKVMTRAGVIGHMHWKHGKDYKAPLLDVPKPVPYGVAQRKAKELDAFVNQTVKVQRAVEALEKDAASGLTHDELRARVGDALAHLSDNLKIDYDEAARLVREQKVHNDWRVEHPTEIDALVARLFPKARRKTS